MRRLFYGDNLEVLQHLPNESVDLVYLDPPFNSAKNYNVIFAREDKASASAQIEAFADTWQWTHTTDDQYSNYVSGGLPMRTGEALRSFHALLGENSAMAYLVNMAPRLSELHRVLKPTGSLYLHCDPTMSHYLKVLLDAIFGAENFINDITWQRSSTRSSISRIYRRAHDVILFYSKNSDLYHFKILHGPLEESTLEGYKYDDGDGRLYSRVPLLVSGIRRGDTGKPWRGIDPNTRGKGGMHWVTTRDVLDRYDKEGKVYWPNKKGGTPRLKYYADESPGTPLSDVWSDIPLISSNAAEALGYPTQKPVALLQRILDASTNPGDIVLDPFAGCGTTIDAAEKLNRQWIGIDVTYIAVDLILKRLHHAYGTQILSQIEVSGIPRDIASAQALFDRNPFDFERWAVSLLNGQPNQKQTGDKGVDGIARFQLGPNLKNLGRILISVKGGKQLSPSMVRDLSGTIEAEKAQMGVLVLQHPPTPGILDAINHGGIYRHPANDQIFPRLQVVTTKELLEGKKPKLPLTLNPDIQA
mgnify:CR=1 FL=1